MNVAVDIRALLEENLTGIGHATLSLLEEMVKDTTIEWYLYYNCQSTVKESPRVKKLLELPHVHLIVTRAPNKLFNLLVSVGITKLDQIVTRRAGITHLDWFFFPNLGFISVSKKTKMLLALHDLTFARFPHYYSLRRRIWHACTRPKYLIKNAHTILVPSESTKRDLMSIFPTHRTVSVIPHGRVEASAHSIESSEEKKEPYILALSTIEPRKNFEGIIQAYKESGIYKKGIKLLVIGGKGWHYKKILKRFETTPGVEYLGYVRHEEKQRLLGGAYALIYPSFYEGFGLPVLEAFSYGVPVITSDRSSLPEVCDGAAYLVRPHMVSDIAHAMRDLVDNPDLREWYQIKGKERAQFFSWGVSAEKVRALCKNVT